MLLYISSNNVCWSDDVMRNIDFSYGINKIKHVNSKLHILLPDKKIIREISASISGHTFYCQTRRFSRRFPHLCLGTYFIARRENSPRDFRIYVWAHILLPDKKILKEISAFISGHILLPDKNIPCEISVSISGHISYCQTRIFFRRFSHLCLGTYFPSVPNKQSFSCSIL